MSPRPTHHAFPSRAKPAFASRSWHPASATADTGAQVRKSWKQQSQKQAGFTIVELMIATVVFSFILLMVSLSILELQRIYYKGINSSKTQEAARSIIQDVSQAIQFNGGQIIRGSDVHCVGNRRYSYALGNKVEDGAVALHGVVVDNPATCNPGDSNLSASAPNSLELLGNNMRVAKFEVEPQGPNNLYKVSVRVVFGDDDLLEDAVMADGTPGTDGVLDRCKSDRAGNQYCAVSELSTVVQQRVQ